MDLESGFEFYNKLFGWTKVSDMDMGPMGIYRIFDEDDHKQMGDGGMMTRALHVDSINAAVERVKSRGGKIISCPMQVPRGGCIIHGQDPQSAMFSLISSHE
jgi:predicted enzyme related to lactoylglutathione lyase